MRTCVITGPTSGIGLATSYEMAKLQYHILLVGRNQKKLDKLKEKLNSKYNAPKVDIFLADLSKIEEVKRVGEEICEKISFLDILINNAGLYSLRRKLVNGLELTFATNHLAYYILTLKLIPILLKSQDSRIVNVSSNGHYSAKFDIDEYLERNNGYKGFKVYAESKLANVLFTYKLNRIFLDQKIKNITINAIHPGVVRTNLARSIPLIGRLFKLNPRFKSAEEGAQTTIYVATSTDLNGISGKYFGKKKEHKSSDISYDEEKQDKIWKLSEEITDIYFTTE